MARYFDIHPADPQPRRIAQVADIVRAGGVIAYPTDSCYALGCQLGNRDGMTRIRSIRGLDDRHHPTLVCQDSAQLGQFAYLANPVFRAIKAATPGSHKFILPATKEVPRILQRPRKKTVGVRILRHVVTQRRWPNSASLAIAWNVAFMAPPTVRTGGPGDHSQRTR